MFKFLKDKLKGFFKKSSEEIVEKIDIKEKIEEEFKEDKEAEKEKAEEKRDKKEKLKDKSPEIEKPLEEKPEGFFAKLRKRYAFRINEELFNKFWAELETVLLESNAALDVVKKIKQNLQAGLIGRETEKEKVEGLIKEELKKAIGELMIEPFNVIKRVSEKKPFVMVFFGINGSGKTTTIAKLVYYLQQHKLSCVLAAADTFRAASIEQLEKHASNLKVGVIKHNYGADAAAVAFDAVSYAKSHNIDAVLIDTAGRMHTHANLMREMEKICRVAKPDLKIFIGEATVGNDMLEQARSFSDSIGIDAIILSKADVDEKGGTAISSSYITKKPILFLGTGQGYGDLKPFDKERVIENLGL
ncbi:signal recognition particle-docking protein FtsY [Candidatus Pacearchaeota archaeon]|nr:signal recognition particle-docking protein FtsY [Candidatus Pacearchaeota archaeon]